MTVGAFSIGLPSRICTGSIFFPSAHAKYTTTISGVVSLQMRCGAPSSSMMRSNVRVTRKLPNRRSVSKATHLGRVHIYDRSQANIATTLPGNVTKSFLVHSFWLQDRPRWQVNEFAFLSTQAQLGLAIRPMHRLLIHRLFLLAPSHRW